MNILGCTRVVAVSALLWAVVGILPVNATDGYFTEADLKLCLSDPGEVLSISLSSGPSSMNTKDVSCAVIGQYRKAGYVSNSQIQNQLARDIALAKQNGQSQERISEALLGQGKGLSFPLSARSNGGKSNSEITGIKSAETGIYDPAILEMSVFEYIQKKERIHGQKIDDQCSYQNQSRLNPVRVSVCEQNPTKLSAYERIACAYQAFYLMGDDIALSILQDDLSVHFSDGSFQPGAQQIQPQLKRQIESFYSHTDQYLAMRSVLGDVRPENDILSSKSGEAVLQALRSYNIDSSNWRDYTQLNEQNLDLFVKKMGWEEYVNWLGFQHALMYGFVLEDLMVNYAKLDMYASVHEKADVWRSQVQKKLETKFCNAEEQPSSGDFQKLNPMPSFCRSMVSHVISRLKCEEYTNAQVVMSVLNDGLQAANAPLLNLLQALRSGATKQEQRKFYEEYFADYVATLTNGPGILLMDPEISKQVEPVYSYDEATLEPMKIFLGLIKIPRRWIDEHSSTLSLHKTFNLKNVQDQKIIEGAVVRMQMNLLVKFSELQKQRKSYLQNTGKVVSRFGHGEISLGMAATAHFEGVGELILYYPDSVARALSYEPQMVFSYKQAIHSLIKEEKAGKTFKDIYMWGMLAIGVVLFLTGIGSWAGSFFLSGGIAAACASLGSTLAIIGLGVTLVDVGVSYRRYTRDKIEYQKLVEATFVGNGSVLEFSIDQKERFDESRIALYLSGGTSVFELGTIKHLYALSKAKGLENAVDEMVELYTLRANRLKNGVEVESTNLSQLQG
ncbi:MAG: hypothetical protein R3A11_07265 [Bdellovibrionota bacterium]